MKIVYEGMKIALDLFVDLCALAAGAYLIFAADGKKEVSVAFLLLYLVSKTMKS